MDAKKIHVAAFDARTELFHLIGKIKRLQMLAHDANLENERSDLDAVACQLASVHESLPWTFVAAAAD
jgi:hypothetical protein